MGLRDNKPGFGRKLKHFYHYLLYLWRQFWQGILRCLGRGEDRNCQDDLFMNLNRVTGSVAEGVRGDAMVVAAQSYLYILGFPLGKTGTNHNGIDGIVGPVTRAAITAFQKMARIGASGGLDLITITELKRACSAGLTIRDLALKASKSGVKIEITPHGAASQSAAADFVNAVYYYALVDERETKVPAAVTTGQAVLASDYGRQVPVDLLTGKNSYNLFGIKGKGPAGSISSWTRELDQATGSWVRVVAQYEAYYSYAESIQRYSRSLKDQPCYQAALENGDPLVLATSIAKAGQSTDLHSAAGLIQLIKDWGFQ